MKILTRVFSVLTSLLVPVFLILLGLRLLLSPLFLQVEYRMPGFPADPYGFTREDRLTWSRPALTYLLNSSDISYLGDLRFSDGSPVFNDRELRHMQDVKVLTRLFVGIFYGITVGLAAIGLWARYGGWWPAYLRSLSRGGWLTLGLVAIIALLAVVDFWRFFTAFHEIFFQGGSWLFYYSDTLIRLFPIRFWQDVFLMVGLVTVGGALGLGLGLRSRPGRPVGYNLPSGEAND